MGHAGAIISMGVGDAASKIKVLREVGVEVAELPSQIPSLLMKVLKK
jgi:succinyl-CoA synthetase alpha subunit